jgi:uncharacterized DUF497 family protein
LLEEGLVVEGVLGELVSGEQAGAAAAAKGKHWSGIITYRGENIRIISVRRSRPEELAIYES